MTPLFTFDGGKYTTGLHCHYEQWGSLEFNHHQDALESLVPKGWTAGT